MGSALYSLGGFTLPFFAVGTFATVMSIVLCLVILFLGNSYFNNIDLGHFPALLHTVKVVLLMD
jgi:hypothetical protein